MPGPLTWEMSPKQLDAFQKKLERYRGLPLHKRLARGTLSAAQYLARPVRAAAPVGATGNLKKSVKARQMRTRTGWASTGTLVGATVTPSAPHRHLVIRSHRIVTRSGVFTGRYSRANPFVDNAVQRHTADAYRIVASALFDKAG